MAYLSDAKRKLRQVVWINLREEVVLECDGHINSLWPPGPTLAPEQLEVGFLAFRTVRMGGTWERRGMRERARGSCTPLVEAQASYSRVSMSPFSCGFSASGVVLP